MNLSGLLSLFDQVEPFEQVVATVGERELFALHLPSAARAPLVAQLFVRLERPVLLLTGRIESASLWQQTLENWLPPGANLLRFREPTPLPYERAAWSDESRLDRITLLTRLLAGQHPFLPAAATPLVVTSIRGLLQKTMPKRTLLTTLKVLRVGGTIDLEKTLKDWAASGYEAVSVVEGPCQFSHRGGILDIYPASSPYPVRIELFGDEIDTMRYFDPTTQRSVAGDVSRVVIPPAREALPGLAPVVGERLAIDTPPKEDDLPAWQDDIEALRAGEVLPHLEYYLQLLYSHPSSLLDYLPADTLILVDDWHEATVAAQELQRKAMQIAGQQITLPPELPSPLFEWDSIAASLLQRQVTVLGEVVAEPEPPAADAPLELADLIQPPLRHGGQERPFLAELQRNMELERRTVVVSRQATRLQQLFREGSRRTISQLSQNGRLTPVDAILQPPTEAITFVQGTLSEGFILEDQRSNHLLQLTTDAEIFGWNRPTPRRQRTQRAVAPETYFSDIEPGDFIVHFEYGVGRFMGMVVRSIGGTDREYLQINYANNDVLYLPVHHADRLSKWVGAENSEPNLHRVGEKRWSQAKKRAQEAVNEMADELLDLYAARETIHGHAFTADGEWQAELEAAFPYQETEDQLQAIVAVKRDMERPMPMDRLICGDVGFGKTEVALRAAFKAVLDGKQVAVLVPTTVLALQHHNNFSERLHSFPVRVELLSRFQTQKEARDIILALREGSVDIVIGTHRLLSDDVGFKDLGLLIIDEEQRFGVAHKEKLKQLRTEVDVLTMTATPIPRTLHMGLAGIRDISIITTPPNERLPVQTYVGASNDELVRRALLRELDRGGQVYFVHNHVQTINAAYRTIHSLVPDARVAIGHGQMPENELEQVMAQFAAHEIDVLICTTIIESGLDIPNANTIIIDQAQNFGLAQLYQLRGRVGRGSRQAYAYLFHAAWQRLTPDAQARLETLDEHTELGAGYSIAMRDLEIRGAGELLGGGQSGHIANVGFDLYTRMLARAVRARKAKREGRTISVEIPDAVTIDLPLPAYLPPDYVPDAALRLRLYRRMAGLEALDEIDGVAAELADRFGPLPGPVDNLLYQLRIKVLASRANIFAITSDGGQVRLKRNFEYIDRFALQRFLGDGARVSKSAIWLDPDLPTHELQVRLVQVLERLREFDQKRVPSR